MLVAAGLINAAQVEQALASQKASGRRLGEELVALGFLNEVQVTQVLSNQLSLPWVSLYHVEFSRELLSSISAETAERFCLIPIYVRSVRREGDTLFIAMDDPTNEEAIEQVRMETGLPIKPMVAPPSEIRNAIRVYYFGGKGRGASAPPASPYRVGAGAAPGPAAVAAPPPRLPPPPPPPPSAPKSPPPEPVADAKASVPKAAEPTPRAEAPAPKKPKAKAKAAPKGPRMITLTLLDGTTVRLPAPGGKGAEADDEGAHDLTATDLVAALLARAQGADVTDVLPDEKWETLFATLLALLVRKGLIADWEFVEEWKKRQG